MRVEDLKTIAGMGRALWADPALSERTTVETFSAATLQRLNEERTLDRAASALLDRAERQGMASNTRLNFSAIGQPFYRLHPEQRFLLIALHEGRWSYARLARILKKNEFEIEEMAWKARVDLISMLEAASSLYPFGAQKSGVSCPEYNLTRPWTQRFLDDEVTSGMERMFLQNHLMACDSCRRALMRCREIYFKVESVLPRVEEESGLINHLAKLLRKSESIKSPTSMTFKESLAIFVRRREIQASLLVLVAILVLRFSQ